MKAKDRDNTPRTTEVTAPNETADESSVGEVTGASVPEGL